MSGRSIGIIHDVSRTPVLLNSWGALVSCLGAGGPGALRFRQASRGCRIVVEMLDTVKVLDDPVEFLTRRLVKDGRLLERRLKKLPNAIDRSGRMTGRHAQRIPRHGSRKERRNVSAASPKKSVRRSSKERKTNIEDRCRYFEGER